MENPCKDCKNNGIRCWYYGCYCGEMPGTGHIYEDDEDEKENDEKGNLERRKLNEKM